MSVKISLTSSGAKYSFFIRTALVLLCSNYLIQAVIGASNRFGRPGIDTPFVILYEKENYRGKSHFQVLHRKTCVNLPESRRNWASSMDVQKHCVRICDDFDCEGNCVMVLNPLTNLNEKGARRLSRLGMNDKVISIKWCYPI